jgi:hypothetical protein
MMANIYNPSNSGSGGRRTKSWRPARAKVVPRLFLTTKYRQKGWEHNSNGRALA